MARKPIDGIPADLFDAAVETVFGGTFSAYMLQESPRYPDALNVLRFYSIIKRLPPEWAVDLWAAWREGELSKKERRKPGRRPRSVVVNEIRALAVELCPGQNYTERCQRAAALLGRIDAPLFYGMYMVVMDGLAVKTMKKSHLAVAHLNPDSRDPYAGLKSLVYLYLPLLVEALETEARNTTPIVARSKPSRI